MDMNSNQQTPNHSVLQAVLTMLSVITAWIGTVALSEVQTIVAICSGLAVLVYTVTNTYVLWRDKIIRDRIRFEESLK